MWYIIYLVVMHVHYCMCICLRPACLQNLFPGYPVSTTLGRVEGFPGLSRSGNIYRQYLGIPYAEPPIGNLRFQPPVTKTPWGNNSLQAFQWGSPCLQFDFLLTGEIIGDEDCLSLNIFTPTINLNGRLPVLVWIHDGFFGTGSSSLYDPQYLMDYGDVVVVTMNYRLGALGFLNTGDHRIRDNIDRFGGDRTRVTLFGESCGGRAIMQSGNLFSPWAYTPNPWSKAKHLGMQLGCPVSNTNVLANCLQHVEGRDIVSIQRDLLNPLYTDLEFFSPSVEAVLGKDTFLGEDPFALVQRGNFSHIPAIFGMNSAEGAIKTLRFEAYPEQLDVLFRNWDRFAPILLYYNQNLKYVSDKLRNYYFPQNSLLVTYLALENITNMISDGVWFHATQKAATQHAKFAPVFLSYFTYKPDRPLSVYAFFKLARENAMLSYPLTLWPSLGNYFKPNLTPLRFGACHADDLIYYWNIILKYPVPALEIPLGGFGYVFSNDLVLTWLQIVKEVPTLKFQNKAWEPVDNRTGSLKYMKLDRVMESGMIDQPWPERIAFIENLGIRNYY